MSLTLTAALQQALQELHVLDPGQTPSSTQLSDGLLRANNFLDNWSSDDLFVHALVKTTWATVGGTQSYTIGAAQVIAMTRPVAIVGGAFVNANGPGGNLKLRTVAEWEAIPDRQRQSFILDSFFWDRGDPTGNILLSPVPLGVLTAEIYSWVPLAQFADTTTPLAMLPAYERAIILQLAVELAPSYDTEPSATTQKNLAASLVIVRQLNAKMFSDQPPGTDSMAQQGRQ